MKIIKGLALLMCLCLVFAVSNRTQAQWSVKVYAIDNPGVTLDSVLIGVNAAATTGLDSALGEKELPPYPPPGAFDFRIESGPKASIEKGSRTDYHPLTLPTQTDSFKIEFSGSDGGSNVILRWPAALASVGGGFWHLCDGQGGSWFADVDMTTQTTFTIPGTPTVDPQWVWIVTGDGKAFHTATSNDLALATNIAGKFAAEKPAPYQSEAIFPITVAALDTPVTGMYVEYSTGVLSHYSAGPFVLPVPDPTGKTKKITYAATGGKVPIGAYSLHVQAAKGKGIVMKKMWWLPLKGGTITKPKAVLLTPPAPSFTKLWLPKPNWNNVGVDMFTAYPYSKASPLAIGLTTSVGKTAKGADIFKYIYHKSYLSDVRKTLYEKGNQHAVGVVACLDVDLKSKAIVKAYNTLPPSKAKPNELIAALLAYKFNLGISKTGQTGTGLGACLYKGLPGDPPAVVGNTLDQLAVKGDSALSCLGMVSGMDMLRILKGINAAFSGPFDSASFGNGTKTGFTVVKPAKALAQVPFIYRTSLVEVAPVVNPNFVMRDPEPSKYELLQNYPNPFNPTTTIEFNLQQDALVTLKIYNILGQEVATLADREEFTEGNNTVEFDASAMASGVYYYRLIVNEGQFQQVKKMMLLK